MAQQRWDYRYIRPQFGSFAQKWFNSPPMLPPQIPQFKGKINGNYQIDCKKNMIQMKRWDYSHYSPPNRVLSPKTKQFAAHFSTTTITKKGKNKIAITRPMEQKLGSAEVGLQLHSPQIFQAFFLQLHNMRTFYAFLPKYGNRMILSNHKGRKGKSGQAGNFISPYSWSQNRGQVIHGEEIWQYSVSAIAPWFLINCHSIFPFVFLQDT